VLTIAQVLDLASCLLGLFGRKTLETLIKKYFLFRGVSVQDVLVYQVFNIPGIIFIIFIFFNA